MWWGQQKAFLDQKRRYWIEIQRWFCLIVIKPEHQNLRVVDTRTEKQLGNPISSRTTSKILHKGSRKNSCSVFSTSTSGQIKKPKKKTVTHFPSVMYEGSPVIMIWFFYFLFFYFPTLPKLSLKSFWINHFRSAHVFFSTGSTHRPPASIMLPSLKRSLFCVRSSARHSFIPVRLQYGHSTLQNVDFHTVFVMGPCIQHNNKHKKKKSKQCGPLVKQSRKPGTDSGSSLHSHSLRTNKRWAL